MQVQQITQAVDLDTLREEWDALLERTVHALKADGTLAKISQRWFNTDITRDDP